MARDYAKQSKSRRNSASTGAIAAKRRITSQRSKSDYGNPSLNNQSRSILPWLVFGCILLIAATGFLVYKIHKDNQNQQAATSLILKKVSSPKKAKKTASPTPEGLQLDFYTMLPSMKVGTSYMAPAQTQAQKKPATTTKPAIMINTQQAAANNSNSLYIVQIASVKRVQDADRLKAQLTLVGFDVNIKQITSNGQIWNRVYIGPFSSLISAKNTQTRLKQFQVDSILNRSSG